MQTQENFFYSVPQYDRIRNHTAGYVNTRLDDLTEARLRRCSKMDASEITERIGELDREWDIDRVLMLNFAVLGGAALAAGLRYKKQFLYLLPVQLGFLAYHAVSGWCPPVFVWRRLGFRTRQEIDAERFALERMLENFEAA